MNKITNYQLPKILIVGTGALGTLFAARLSQAGYDITMLGTWKEGIASLQKDGVRLFDSNGNETTFKVQATDDPGEYVGTKHALVLVKAWQTERAARQLSECLADDGLALTLQNGLGNYETLTEALNKSATENAEKKRDKDSAISEISVAKSNSRVALGSTTSGATLIAPGVARAGGEGVVSIQRHEKLAPIEAALTSAKFNVHLVEDAQSLVWGKLVINAAINPLTALLRVPNGELLNRPSAREMMATLAREVAEVAHAENIKLPFDDPAAMAEEVARKTAANQSSMLQDVLRNAPTEIDAICGAVVKIGKKHNIETPINWACWQLARSLQNPQ
ncbi:MAG TPA: 2-dehydropantoate 2-reductase [Anaerolineales bacterium]|nr:2-dehydropantoate 2-reductase [Anaerolineales bacterium]HNQ94200.1 2-dehydropantoate 2-reductase [Anaerolineales bacterium]HNS61235.1 2-dehydropantoate 2-reductase [Anaerolineales bacterium]